jgi:DNA topoisomerase-3
MRAKPAGPRGRAAAALGIKEAAWAASPDGQGDVPATAHREKPRAGGRALAARSAPAADDGTPLKIPFGNKETALRLGARYRAGGWFAPQGTDLEPFREKGWL